MTQPNNAAFSILNSLEQARTEEIQIVDAKYNALVEQVRIALGISGIPAAKAAPIARAKVAPFQRPNTRDTVIIPPRPAVQVASEVEPEDGDYTNEDAKEPATGLDLHDNVNAIHLYLLANSDGVGRGAILDDTNMSETDFTAAVNYMLQNKKIRKEGERRGTKYYPKTAFED